MQNYRGSALDAVSAALGVLAPGADAAALSVATPPDPSLGDLSVPCFPLARVLRRAPAQIAAELAALSPHRVRRLILANPVGLWLDNHPVADFFAMTPDQLGIALWHDPESEVAKAMMAVPEDEQAQLQAYLVRMQHLATAGKFLWPIPDKGLKKRIHRVEAPTLILWGQSDGLVPVEYAQAFQRAIRNAQVSIMRRCGHMPMYENPAAFVEEVTGFLNGA